VSALEQPHCAIHLGEQSSDRRLAGAGIAEEDQVLRRRDLRQAVPLPLRLHLQERDERTDLILDRLEPDQGIELRLQLGQRARRLRSAELVRDPVAGIGRARGLGQALAQDPQAAGDVLEWIPCHG